MPAVVATVSIRKVYLNRLYALKLHTLYSVIIKTLNGDTFCVGLDPGDARDSAPWLHVTCEGSAPPGGKYGLWRSRKYT